MGVQWLDKSIPFRAGCREAALGIFARIFENLQANRFDFLHFLLHQAGHSKGDDNGVVIFTPKIEAHGARTWSTLGIEQNDLFSGTYIAGLGPSFASTTVVEDFSSNLSISALVRMKDIERAGMRARVEVNKIFQRVFAAWISGERSLEQTSALLLGLLGQYDQDPAVAQVGVIVAYHQGFTVVGRCGNVAISSPSNDSISPVVVGDPNGNVGLAVFDRGVERIVLGDNDTRTQAASELVIAGLGNKQIPVEDFQLKKWNGLAALRTLEPVLADGAVLIFSNQWMFRSSPSPLCQELISKTSGIARKPGIKVSEGYLGSIYGPLPSRVQSRKDGPQVEGKFGEASKLGTNGTAVAVPTGSTVAADSTSVPQTPNDGMQQSKANVAALDLEAVRKLVRQNPKVTFSPEWKQEYDETRKPLPPDPNWIEIEGYGRVTREQALAGTFTLTGAILELADAQVVRLRWLPKGWQNTIGLS